MSARDERSDVGKGKHEDEGQILLTENVLASLLPLKRSGTGSSPSSGSSPTTGKSNTDASGSGSSSQRGPSERCNKWYLINTASSIDANTKLTGGREDTSTMGGVV